MMCQKESLLAFSVMVKVSVRGSAVELEGPGFVFLGTADIVKQQVTVGRIVACLLLVFMVEIFLTGFGLEV